MRVAKWNFDRGNINFDKELETRMLAEEAQEFKDGMALYFQDRLHGLVEMVDAWCDYQFVLQGTIYKYLGNDVPFDFEAIKTQEKFMVSMLMQCGLDREVLELCFQAVVAANEAKGTEKVNGKIQKGPNWKDPKETIFNLLKENLDV